MNIAKTKYMSLGTDINHLELDKGDISTGFTEFRYLGSIFTKDGRHTKNTRRGGLGGGNTSTENSRVWWSKDLTRNRVKMIYSSLVRSGII